MGAAVVVGRWARGSPSWESYGKTKSATNGTGSHALATSAPSSPVISKRARAFPFLFLLSPVPGRFCSFSLSGNVTLDSCWSWFALPRLGSAGLSATPKPKARQAAPVTGVATLRSSAAPKPLQRSFSGFGPIPLSTPCEREGIGPLQTGENNNDQQSNPANVSPRADGDHAKRPGHASPRRCPPRNSRARSVRLGRLLLRRRS